MVVVDAHNWLSTFALLLWPLAALVLFRVLPMGRAILWTVLGAQLLLPASLAFKFEMIPQFDKASIPAICVFLGAFIFSKRPPMILRGFGFANVIVFAVLVGPFATSLLNGDPIAAGGVVLPGTGVYDGVSAMEGAFIQLLPFFVGRQFLDRDEDCRNVLTVLVSAELIYTLPMLFEVRFSPQLHYWVYGFFSHEFQQSVRDNGFRPIVFMGHGLLASFFLATATIASVALWRTQSRTIFGRVTGLLVAYLALVLVLCKSLGALVYCLLLAPLTRFATPNAQMRVAVVLALIAFSYPLLRALDWIPVNLALSLARVVSVDRALSLQTRFDNEEKLLAKALERPVFGWGRFGRNRVYDEDSGRDVSITDGYWLITLGQFGVFGFIAEFGLMLFTVFRASTALKYCSTETDKILLSALALIVSISILDLIPNAGLVPWMWLMCGALQGRAERLERNGKKLKSLVARRRQQQLQSAVS